MVYRLNCHDLLPVVGEPKANCASYGLARAPSRVVEHAPNGTVKILLEFQSSDE
jgi:hypothetical protein